jgi:hypothetical protein
LDEYKRFPAWSLQSTAASRNSSAASPAEMFLFVLLMISFLSTSMIELLNCQHRSIPSDTHPNVDLAGSCVVDGKLIIGVNLGATHMYISAQMLTGLRAFSDGSQYNDHPEDRWRAKAALSTAQNRGRRRIQGERESRVLGPPLALSTG